MEKKNKKHRLINACAAYILVFTGGVSGIIASKNFTDAAKTALIYVSLCCILITVLLFLFSYFAKKRFLKRKLKPTVAENDRFFVSLLESADTVSEKTLSLLKHIRRASDMEAVVLGVFAFIIPFTAGVNCGILFLLALAISALTLSLSGALFVDGLTVSLLIGTSGTLGIGFANNFLLYLMFSVFALIPARSALARVRLEKPSKAFEEIKSVLPETDYPLLYSIAKKASVAVGFKGGVRLGVDSDCNMKIVKMDKICTVLIGILFLSQASEEELYTVILHEFAHWTGESSKPVKEVEYDLFLENFSKNFFNIAFNYIDSIYHYNFSLFTFISSKLNEKSADEVMIRYGNASSAASALLKLGYYDLYQWESFNFDFESVFAPERLSRFYMLKCVKLFEKSLDERKDAWNELIKKEISAPGETHPITKTRLETFGVSEYNTEPKASSAEYIKEYSQALLIVDNFIYRKHLVDFEKQRDELYLKPKSKIEKWEASGKPVQANNYAEISHYLKLLGRVSEANELLNTAIKTFSEKEAAYAIFLSGFKMLHDYDEAGIEYVYRAIGLNRMYASEGLEAIGQFCRLTGNQEEYTKCREKSAEILQKNKDIHKEFSVLRKKDRLTAERLPGQIGDNIVRLAVEAGGLRVSNIYVVRKTIAEDLFTIAIIVRFAPQTELHTQVLVMNSIRSYLRVFKDRQFSVFRYKKVAKAKVENIDSSCIYTSR